MSSPGGDCLVEMNKVGEEGAYFLYVFFVIIEMMSNQIGTTDLEYME